MPWKVKCGRPFGNEPARPEDHCEAPSLTLSCHQTHDGPSPSLRRRPRLALATSLKPSLAVSQVFEKQSKPKQLEIILAYVCSSFLYVLKLSPLTGSKPKSFFLHSLNFLVIFFFYFGLIGFNATCM